MGFDDWSDRHGWGLTASHHIVHEGGAHAPQAVDSAPDGPVALCRGRVLGASGWRVRRGPGGRDLILEALQVGRVAAVVAADGAVSDAAPVELQRPRTVAGARGVGRLELAALLVATRWHAGRRQKEHGRPRSSERWAREGEPRVRRASRVTKKGNELCFRITTD